MLCHTHSCLDLPRSSLCQAWEVPPGDLGAPRRAGISRTKPQGCASEGSCLWKRHSSLSSPWQLSEQIEQEQFPVQGAQGHSSAWREVPGACAFSQRGRFVSFDSLLKIAEKFSVLCSWDTGQLCVPLALGLPQLCPVTLHGGHLPSSVDFGTIPQSAACLPLPQFQGQLTYIFITLLRFKHCSNSCPTANLPPPVPMCDPQPCLVAGP